MAMTPVQNSPNRLQHPRASPSAAGVASPSAGAGGSPASPAVTATVHHGLPIALDKDIDEELLLDVPAPPARMRHPISPMHHSTNVGGGVAAAATLTANTSRATTTPLLPPGGSGTSIGGGKQGGKQQKQQHHHQQQQQQQQLPNRNSSISSSSNGSGGSQPHGSSKSNKSKRNKASRIESFHNAVLTNMKETEQLRRRQGSGSFSSIGGMGGGGSAGNGPTAAGDVHSGTSLLTETMRDISTAAASTIETLKAALQHAQRQQNANNSAPFVPPATVSYVANETNHPPTNESSAKSPTNMFTKLCGSPEPKKGNSGTSSDDPNHATATSSSSSSSTWEPHMKKMQEAVSKVVDVNQLQQTTQDIWRFASSGGERDHYNNHNNNGSNNHGNHKSRRHHEEEDELHNSTPLWANLLGGGFGLNHDDPDDQNTVGTFDTWQEENSQLRRLGSWGTIGSGFTNGTNGTFGTYTEQGGSPTSSQEYENIKPFVLEDDAGNAIDPVLLERAQKLKLQQRQQQQQQNQNGKDGTVVIGKDGKPVKRRRHRTKVVQFDYPPIKSLRQYIRPDPEDLPNLFFTEQELDQIEEDRYCTMSTDDIEIVAVSSKLSSSEEEDDREQRPQVVKKQAPRNTTSSSSNPSVCKSSSAEARDSPSPSVEHNPGFKNVRSRCGTPHRRRPADIATTDDEDDEDADPSMPASVNSKGSKSGAKSPKSPSSSSRRSQRSGRLVKGVQIYLRERSTGA